MNIRDIAKCAGVSSATVSRVMNQSGYVKEETRQKVQDAINDANYVPNAIARSLSTQDTCSIGVIVPDITNEFFPILISGIGEIAEQNNYNIVFFDSCESLEKEHSFLKTVESQRLAGVVITPISEADCYTSKTLLQLEQKGIPVVLVDRDIQGSQLDGVFVDNLMGAYEGVTALINAGHTNIAIITGPDTSLPGKNRFLGYCKALTEQGLTIHEEYVVSGDFKIEKAYERTKQLLTLENPPTAIFTSNNMTTLGVLKYLTECKIKLGKDISVIGFDQIESLKIIDYKLSTIERDAKEQGRESMKLLFHKLKHEEYCGHTKHINVPYKVVLRGSERLG